MMDFSHALESLKGGYPLARKAWIRDLDNENVKALLNHVQARTLGPWKYGVPFVVMMTALSLPPFNTQGTSRKVNDRTASWIGEDNPLESQPYLSHYDPATNAWQPGWLPSTADIFAEDWITL